MAKLRASKIINAINKGIAVNPTEITFTQIIKKEVDGAFEEEIITKIITVLIYLEDSSNSINISTGTQGTSYSTNRYKMIADKDADLEINPQKAIQFDCLEGHMEIKGTYLIKIDNTICGYMCDLERID